MIDVRTEAYPAKQIKVVCTDCNTTLATVEWGNYAEYQRKKANLKKWYTVCDKCAPPPRRSSETEMGKERQWRLESGMQERRFLDLEIWQNVSMEVAEVW